MNLTLIIILFALQPTVKIICAFKTETLFIILTQHVILKEVIKAYILISEILIASRMAVCSPMKVFMLSLLCVAHFKLKFVII